MRLLLVLSSSVLILAGCSTTVALKHDFPSVPPSLMEKPAALKEAKNPGQLSDLVEVSVTNMGEYHQLAEKYKSWQRWYLEQKKIFDESQK
jgi:hypothetical protein